MSSSLPDSTAEPRSAAETSRALPQLPPSLQTLRAEVARLQGTALDSDRDIVSSGHGGLDRLLPRGGFARGTLVEWIAERPGSAAGTLALLAAREASRQGGYVVVLDSQRWFYPPAAAAWGLDLDRTLVVRADQAQDELWAIDQSLRCPSVAAVWASVSHLDRQLQAQSLRRWQLAAEQSGVLGLLIRSANARQLPCWSDAQLLAASCGGRGADESWRLRVELLKVRGGAGGGVVELELSARNQRPPRAGQPLSYKAI